MTNDCEWHITRILTETPPRSRWRVFHLAQNENRRFTQYLRQCNEFSGEK